MALSVHTTTVLNQVLGPGHAAEIVTIANAGSGTLSSGCLAKLVNLFSDAGEATRFKTALDAGSAMTGRTQRYLAVALGNTAAAADIAAELAS